jgi:hypothetical protein
MEYEELVRIAREYKLIVFGGYSVLGYERPEALARIISALVTEAGDGTLYLGGGTKVGIGLAYEVIRRQSSILRFKNVKTAGIVSMNALTEGIELAEQDYLHYVRTAPGEWRVLRGARSLMVDIAAESNGKMIYFSGGAVARDEILEALARGVPVTVAEGPEIEPKREEVEKALAKNPSCIVYGTLGISGGISGLSRWHAGMDASILTK